MIAIGVGLLGLATYLWQLSVPFYLQLYDSGVDMASAMHLVSGVVPYRGFSFVQPPGILWILSPVAVAGRIHGTHDGFIIARVQSAAVTALDAGLLSWLVRRRGRVAMVIAGAGAALIPAAVFFSSGIRLEPYCLLFVLMGSLMLDSWQVDATASTMMSSLRSCLLFGVAGSIEFWAFFPFLAALICVILFYRGRVAPFVSGAGVGIIFPRVPFLILAPQIFFDQVLFEQLHHSRLGANILERLVYLTGFSGTALSPDGWGAVIIFAVLGAACVIAFLRGPRVHLVDAYLLIATAICLGGLLLAATAYPDYGYFATPFLCGLIAVTVTRLVEWGHGELRPELLSS